MSDWNTETAEWYAANYGDYPTNRLAVDYLDLPDHITIVDVGCGTGSALRHTAQKVKHGILIGIDPVPRMIEIAREQTKKFSTREQITFKVGTAEELPVDDNVAHYVFAFDSIDHWIDVNRGLDEVRRILKSDGRFIIVKDKTVPGSKTALKTLRMSLNSKGYKLHDQNEIQGEDVTFSIWICV